MVDQPPLAALKHMPVMTLVKFLREGLKIAIKKNWLEHVLADLIEELDEEDLPKIKWQLDRVEGIGRAIIDRRIRWGAWAATAPVKETTNGR